MKKELKVYIVGKPGSGKSTLAQIIKDTLKLGKLQVNLIDDGGSLLPASFEYIQDTQITIETVQAKRFARKRKPKGEMSGEKS